MAAHVETVLRTDDEEKKMAGLVDDSLVSITGIAVSLGRLKISALEKAKTIEEAENKVKGRYETITKGLGIDFSSVADVGETVVTEAALATVKLILQQGIRPSEVKTFIVATETPTGSSENMGIQVKKAVNIVLDKLRRQGLADLDEFNPSLRFHLQSACTSQGSAIAGFAVNGLEGGKAIVVSADNALYRLHTPADATGGFGSVAICLEKTEPQTKGIRLSRKIGSADADVPDFIKVIFGDTLKESGLELVAKYPVVFGDYSNEAYTKLRYKSLKDFAKESGLNINDVDVTKRVVWLPHIPYPAIVEKEVAYLVRHLSRHDDVLREKIKNEMNNAREAFLGGYTHIEDELDFLVDVGALYYGVIGVPKELKARLAEREGDVKNGELVDERLNANKDYLIGEMLATIERIARRDNPTNDLLDAINETVKNLEALRGSEKLSLENFEDAFKPLYEVKKDEKTGKPIVVGVIPKFEKADKDYNAVLRDTPTFKEIKKRLGIDAIIELSKVIGNIYTGSEGLGMVSYFIHSDDPESKYIIMSYYGSGGESYTIFGIPKEISEMIALLNANVEAELKSQRKINAEEYVSIRNNSTLILNDDAPLTHDTMFRHINANKARLLEHMEPYIISHQRTRAVEDTATRTRSALKSTT